MHSANRQQSIYRFDNQSFRSVKDQLTVEEPLEIRLAFGIGTVRQQRSLAITMRTPKHDFDLVRGFLFTEGIISSSKDIIGMRYIGAQLEESAQENVLLVDLHADLEFDFEKLNRHFYTSSSCGVCGKASIEMVQTTTCYLLSPERPKVKGSMITQLPTILRAQQEEFEQTGGLHAVGLFNTEGQLLFSCEDVGRHNAMDKLIGKALKKNLLPLSDKLLLVSGRVSFELVQKAVMAGVPILAAVGAPSTLAIDLAEEHGMTIIGFLKKDRFNIYCGVERLKE